MNTVFTKAMSFLIFIALGYLCRKKKWLPKETAAILVKINLNICLPCLVIINFSGSGVDLSLIFLVFLGLLEAIITVLAGALLSRKMPQKTRITYMVGTSAYNIGTFATPFLSSFLSPASVVAACVFDTGNAIASTGVTAALSSLILKLDGEKPDPLKLVRKLLSNITIITYITMFILGLIGISVPAAIQEILRPAANANMFIAMFMLGLMFHIEFRREYLNRLFQMLGMRFALSVLFALGSWFLLPFPLEVRQALTLLPFAPITSLAPAFTQMNGGDEGLASCANSLSIAFSIICLTLLVGFIA